MSLDAQLWDAGVKLLAAVLLSAPLGLERERKERPAGLRTHVLVCLGATLMLIVSEFLASNLGGDPARFDRARIAAGVITGVGFLGAGTIFMVGADQHGLTTAAMIWFVAALGVAIGAGYIAVAALGAAVALAVVVGFEYIERRLPAPQRTYRLTVVLPGGAHLLGDIEDLIRGLGFRGNVSELRVEKGGADATIVFGITSYGYGSIENLAKAITERYEGVEKVVLDR